MKTTIVYYVWNFGQRNEWREPYLVLRGVAKELCERYPQTYSMKK